MAGELGRAGFQAVFEDQGVVKGLKGIDSQANNTVSKAGGAFSSLGGIAKTALGVVSVSAIAAVGTKLINTASDAAEFQSKFDTVFSTTGKNVETWADELADTIGRSRTEIKKYTADTADLFMGMGEGEESAGALSQQMVELAYDLASFNNVQDTQALDAMKSALMGEAESAKALGLNLGETTVKNSDYVKSLGKSWDEMTLAEKAQARLNEAIKQSPNAMGDAERTSDSYANQQKRLQASFEDLSIMIGSVFLPIATTVVSTLNDFLEPIKQLVSGEMSPTQFFEQFTTGAQSLITQAPAMIQTGFDFVNNLVTGFVNSLPMVIENLTGVVSTMITFFYTNMPTFIQSGYDIVLNLVNGLLASVPNLLESMGTLFQTLFTNIEANLPTFLENGKQFVFNMVDGILESLPNIIDSAVVLLEQFISTTVENLPSIIKTGVEFALSFVSGILERLPDLIASAVTLVSKFAWTISLNLPQILAAGADILWTVVDGIMSLFYKIPEVGGQIIKGLWTGMGNLASWLFEKVANFLPQNIAEPIRNFIPKLFDVGGDIVRGIWNGITGMGGWLWEKVSGFVSDKIMSPVKNFFGIKSPSRTMRDEVGKMIPQGLAIGIEADADKATSAMDDLSASLIAEPVQITTPEKLRATYGTNSDNVSRETSQQQTAVRPIILQIGNKEFARAVVDVTTEQDRINLLMGV